MIIFYITDTSIFLKTPYSNKNCRTVLTSLSFKGSYHAYLLKTFYNIPNVHIFILIPISGKSAAQLLSLNLTYTFLLVNFSIIDLCDFSASCSCTLSCHSVFLSKTCRPYLLMLFYIHHVYDF